jgi:hypothetical protein
VVEEILDHLGDRSTDADPTGDWEIKAGRRGAGH